MIRGDLIKNPDVLREKLYFLQKMINNEISTNQILDFLLNSS